MKMKEIEPRRGTSVDHVIHHWISVWVQEPLVYLEAPNHVVDHVIHHWIGHMPLRMHLLHCLPVPHFRL